MSVTIVIAELPKMNTAHGGGKGARGAHWSVERAERKRWDYLVHLATRRNKPWSTLKHAKITYRRYACRPGSYDYDNLVQSFKNVQDSLISNGVIESDSAEFIGHPTYESPRCKTRKEQRIEITVEAVEERKQ